MLRLMTASVLLATLPAAAFAQATPKAPASAQVCVSCHGPKGISFVVGTPSLAGQPDIFTQYQLVFMRDGQREPGTMKPFVRNLTDENIRELGAYYAALPPPPAQKAPGEVDEARVQALMGPRRCGSCHKEDFSGQGESARLAGQRADYLAKSLADFKAGARRGRGMAAMMEVAVTLQDDEIKMIAIWLARKP